MSNTIACDCLNVMIHMQESNMPDTHYQGDSAENLANHFVCPLYEVTLGLGGIDIVYAALTQKSTCEEWNVHKCLNCGLVMFADSHMHEGKVLVNSKAKNDSTSIQALRRSDNYSSLYKIVLSLDDNQVTQTIEFSGLDNEKYNQVTSIQRSITGKSDDYLKHQQALTEDKIKEFEEAEWTKYRQIQKRIYKEKSAMLALIHTHCVQPVAVPTGRTSSGVVSERKTSNPSNPMLKSPTLANQQRMKPQDYLRHSANLDDSYAAERDATDKDLPKDSPTQHKSRTPNKKSTKPRHGHFRSNFDDDDFMFGMDDELGGSDNKQFPDSDDSSDNEDAISGRVSAAKQRGIAAAGTDMMSQSVPVSIPAFVNRRSAHLDEPDDDEDERERFRGLPMEDMAASISALAKSVHMNDEDIFGPRPDGRRYNRPL